MTDRPARPRTPSLKLMKSAGRGRGTGDDGRIGGPGATSATPDGSAGVKSPPPVPRILGVDVLLDLSQPKFRLRYGQGADEGGASALVKALDATVPGGGNEVGLRLALDAGAGEARAKLFFRVPQHELGLAPDHAIRAFCRVRESSISEAASLLTAGGDLHVFVVTGGEQLVDLASGQPGYSLAPLAGEGAGLEWRELLDGVLPSIGVPCVADLIVRPVSLPEAGVAALREEIEHLSLLESAYTSERRSTGRSVDLARRGDPIAGRLRKDLEALLEVLLGGLVYEFTIRVMCSSPAAGELLSRVIGSSLAGGQRFDVVHLGPGDSGHEAALGLGRSFSGYGEGQRPVAALTGAARDAEQRLEALRGTDPARGLRLQRIRSLNRIVGREVGGAMLRLPTSRGAAFRTINLDTTAEGAANGATTGEPALVIGRAVETGHLFSMGVNELLRHVFTSGFTGSGKTTTIKVLLRQLWEKFGIPFVVLEPAKAEYRALLQCGNAWAGSLRIFTPGLERLSPLRFNPFVVPHGCTVEEHIATLTMCLAATMSLGGPLDAFLDAGVRWAYEEAGDDEEDLCEECNRFPDIDALLRGVRAVAKEAGYQGEVAGNLDAAIRKRVQPLTWGSVGRIFRTSAPFPAISDLLAWPTIIELQALSSRQQSFLTLLYLSSLLRDLRTLGPSRKLRLVIVIEEAHGLIPAHRGVSRGNEEADPEGHAARFLVKLLAEIRAYGVGIIVVDQIPSAVAPEVVKNTNVKITHGVADGEERDTIAAAMLLEPAVEESLSRLMPGEALVFFNGIYRAVHLEVDGSNGAGDPPDDNQVLAILAEQEWFREATERRLSAELESLLVSSKDELLEECRGVLARKGYQDHHSLQRVVAQTELTRRRLERRLGWLGRVLGEEGIGTVGKVYRERLHDLVRAVSSALDGRGAGKSSHAADDPKGGGHA